MRCALCGAVVLFGSMIGGGDALRCVRGHVLVFIPTELVETFSEINGRVVELQAGGA